MPVGPGVPLEDHRQGRFFPLKPRHAVRLLVPALAALLSPVGCATKGPLIVGANLQDARVLGLERPDGLVQDPASGQWALSEVMNAYWALRNEAARDGWRLVIISGYRSFEGQLSIWNGKFESLDRGGRNGSPGSPPEKTFGPFMPGPLPWEAAPDGPVSCRESPRNGEATARGEGDHGVAWKTSRVMRYISMPGFSRHHWGTDLDLGEESIRERVQAPTGPQAGRMRDFYNWLDLNAPRFGFCRVYQGGEGAIHDEPWHWSYLRLASVYERRLRSMEDFPLLDGRKMDGWDYIRKRLPEAVSLMVNSVRPECSSLEGTPLKNEYGDRER